jgi:hypothetical protein
MRETALELLEQVPEADGAVLRARILCQQGRLSEGVRWWKKAVEADGGNEEAKRGLALAERMARSSLWRLRLHGRRVALVVLVLAIVFALGTWWALAPRGVSADRELAGSVRRLEQQVSSGNTSSHADLAALARLVSQKQNVEAQSQEQVRVQLQRLQQSLRRLEKTVAQQAK